MLLHLSYSSCYQEANKYHCKKLDTFFFLVLVLPQGVKPCRDCPTALGRRSRAALQNPVGQDWAAQEVLGADWDSSPSETPHSSMAEGPRSWRDFSPARSDGEVARGATSSLWGAADTESTGRAQRLGLRSMDPAWEEMRGAATVTEVEDQFLHLAIRKQVSYR